MANIKAIEFGSMREILIKNNLENKFLEKLSPELLHAFTRLPSIWVPEKDFAQIMEIAAELLFPKNLNRVWELGETLAAITCRGIFKFFFSLKLVKLDAATANMAWRRFADSGECAYENITEKSMDLVILNYPQLTKTSRQFTGGHQTVIMKLILSKPVKITIDESDPNAWRYHMSW